MMVSYRSMVYLAAFLSIGGIVCAQEPRSFSNERHPCMIPGVGFIANNRIDECARIAQAYKGQGIWGGHELQMTNGNLMLDGRSAGKVPNYSNTYGSLSQRCQSGDSVACDQLSHQTRRATDDYTNMMRGKNLGQ